MSKIAILGGGRIPFQPSGTVYKNHMGYDLVKSAINGLFNKVKIDPHLVNHVLIGNVIQENACASDSDPTPGGVHEGCNGINSNISSSSVSAGRSRCRLARSEAWTMA